MDGRDDGRKLFDRTLDVLRSAGTQAADGLRRTYEVSTLTFELRLLRRDLDREVRALGQLALEHLRSASGRLDASQATAALECIRKLEAEVAAKERLVTDIESNRDAGTTPPP